MRGDGRLEHRGTQKDIECCHENIFRTNDPSNVRGEVIMSFALTTAILTMAFALFGRPACGGEIVDCVEAPEGRPLAGLAQDAEPGLRGGASGGGLGTVEAARGALRIFTGASS